MSKIESVFLKSEGEYAYDYVDSYARQCLFI